MDPKGYVTTNVSEDMFYPRDKINAAASSYVTVILAGCTIVTVTKLVDNAY